MERDKIDAILEEIDKADFGLAFAMIPEDKKAAFVKATSLGYLDIDPGNNYCLSRIGRLIVDSGLSYREWEAKNSKPDGTGLLDDGADLLTSTSYNSGSDPASPVSATEKKSAKKSWLSILGLK